MSKGITVRVLGDSGPFSKTGDSVGYLITIGEANYILDCGAPLFKKIDEYILKSINGLIVTHCHDDHKRWYTDFAIFHKYKNYKNSKVPVFATGEVITELCKLSEPPLDRSLSSDSKTVIDIPCEEYIQYRTLGPKDKYMIVRKDIDSVIPNLSIVDNNGNIIGPDKAKIVISKTTRRPRMLFKDPDYNEWVEPDSFYPFSAKVFYEDDPNIHYDPEGFSIEAIKAPVWHGIPNFGVKFKTSSETLIFSSDTVHDVAIWKELYSEKREQNLGMARKEFESTSIIYGNINDYIERTWSEERYNDAVNAFHYAVVIHDVSIGDNIVHIGYDRLKDSVLKRDMTLLTHSPDEITSEWPLCCAEKQFKIEGKKFYEIVGNKLNPMNADIYHKRDGKYYVGYKKEDGPYTVYEKKGLLCLCPCDEELLGEKLFRVEMYEDISGKYFPIIEDDNMALRKRNDGKIEEVTFTRDGSTGKIVEDHRSKLKDAKSETTELKA